MTTSHGLRRIREELGQLSWVGRHYLSRERIAVQARVIRRMEVPRLPRRRRRPGSVWAVSMVRDERDIIGATLQHLLHQGVDHLLIADNGSRDGTADLLHDLARHDERVFIAHDHEVAYHQAEKMSYLAHVAWRHGAEWILPFDADEFFFARKENVADFLRSQDSGVVHAAFHHMVAETPTLEPDSTTTFVMDSSPAFPGKVAARAHPFLELIRGNHGAYRVGGQSSGLHIAHALYRSPEQLARKFRQGMQSVTAGRVIETGQHWIKGAQLSDDEVARVWDLISAGEPAPEIEYAATGPMVRVKPLGWKRWDPDRQLPPA